MRSFYLILLAVLCSAPLFSQQDANYTGYMFNGLVINPAYAGSHEVNSAMVYYRYQWATVDRAPRTLAASVHGRFSQNSGVGLYMENDNIGVHDRISVKLIYSYRIKVGSGNLQFGLQGGIQSHSSDFSQLELLPDANDALLTGSQSKVNPNFGAGLYYYTRKFFLGVSMPHFLDSDIWDPEAPIETISVRKKHYFVTAGGILPISESVKIRPSAMLRAVPGDAPLSFDLNVNAIFRDALTVGLSHRLSDSVSFLLGYKFNRNLSAGYAYDYPLTDISYARAATHDFFVGYDFGFSDDKVVSPRFF